MARVELDLDPVPPRRPLGPPGQPHRLTRGGFQQPRGARRRQADRRVPAHAFLDLHQFRVRRVVARVLAGLVVAADQQHRHAVLAGHRGVQPALARRDVVQPHAGDL
ncbi:conserved hypothetical protein, partial [Ricinus communis]